MSNQDSEAQGPRLATNRTMDIVVALLLLGLASVFMFDSWRVGFGWIEGQGPAPGFFPFYVCLILAVSSVVTLIRAVGRIESDGDETFVTRPAFLRVLMVLVPTAVYVFLIEYLGIYVSSAIFVAGFMLAFRESILKSLLVGIGVPLALFMMFEKWFLVPLPKGPLEAMLGL
jgi:putative tricarboxylic transport membrane protein